MCVGLFYPISPRGVRDDERSQNNSQLHTLNLLYGLSLLGRCISESGQLGQFGTRVVFSSFAPFPSLHIRWNICVKLSGGVSPYFYVTGAVPGRYGAGSGGLSGLAHVILFVISQKK